MGLTPLDVRKQEFRRVMRGVDADEVKVFLGLVAEEMERLIRANTDLQGRVSELTGQIEEFRSLEKALRDSVVTAQGMREEARQLADKEGQLITRRAEQEAERIVRDAEARVSDLKRELAELQSDRRNYLIRLRSLVETHMKMVEAGEMRATALDAARGGESQASRTARAVRAHAEASAGEPVGDAAARRAAADRVAADDAAAAADVTADADASRSPETVAAASSAGDDAGESESE
jgi:cell division initiation protein